METTKNKGKLLKSNKITFIKIDNYSDIIY